MAKSKLTAVSEPDRDSVSLSIRKIDNGFVMSKSHSTNKGYEYTERFYDKKPKIDISAVAAVDYKPHKSKGVSELRKAAGNKKVRET